MTAGAIEAGKTQVRIEGKSTLKRDLAKQLGHVKRFASSASKAFGSVALKLGKGGLAGAAAGGFLVKLGADAEKTQLIFKNLLGSADKATDVIKQMNILADSTPFSNDDILQASKLLLANGSAVENINGEMRTLATLAAKAGSTTSELALILQDIRGKGKIDTQDIRQFASRGINLRAALGAQLGLSQAETQKRISSPLGQGSISPEQVEAALKSLADGLPNLLKEVGQSTSGLFSTLVGQLRSVGKEFGQIIIEDFNLKDLMSDGIEFIKTNRPQIVAFFKELLLNIRTFIEQLKIVFKSIADSRIFRGLMKLAGDIAGGSDGSFAAIKAGLRQQDFVNKMAREAERRASLGFALDQDKKVVEQAKKQGLLTIDDIIASNKQKGAAKLGVTASSTKGLIGSVIDGIKGAAGKVSEITAKAVGSTGSAVSFAKNTLPLANELLQQQTATRGTFSSTAASRFLGGKAGQSPLLAQSKKQSDLLKEISDNIDKLAGDLGFA